MRTMSCCESLSPFHFWESLAPRTRVILAAVGITLLQLSDLISDIILLSGVAAGTAEPPCQFCSYGHGLWTRELNDYATSFHTSYEDRENSLYFDASCLNKYYTERPVYMDACYEDFDNTCSCKFDLLSEIDFILIRNEAFGFVVYAIGLLCIIIAKELFKLAIIVLFFCSKRYHTTAWFKYAVNSPFLLLAIWAPSVRTLIVDTIEAELEHREQAFHILMDLLIEDIPQLLIPIWYCIRGKPSFIAIISLALSVSSIMVTVYRVMVGIEWRHHASRIIASVKVNAGLEMQSRSSDVDSDLEPGVSLGATEVQGVAAKISELEKEILELKQEIKDIKSVVFIDRRDAKTFKESSIVPVQYPDHY